MKKIYTLLAAACVSASMMAVPMKKMENVSAKAPAKHSMAEMQRMSAESPVIPGGKQKITDKASGAEYEVLMFIEGPWELYDRTTGNTIPFEEYPFYDMTFVCQDHEGTFFAQTQMQWPAYGALNYNCYDEEGNIVVSKVEEIYGDKAFKAMSYEDFTKEYVDKDGKSITMLYTLPGFYYMPCMLGAEIYGDYASRYAWQVSGQSVYPVSATVSNNQLIPGDCATLNWLDFDQIASDVNMEFNANYTTTVGGSRTGARQLELEGSATMIGFGPIEFDNIGEVHIFNGGRQIDGTEWTWNYNNFGTQPLNYFYLCFCDKSVGYMAKNAQTGETEYQFTADDLPKRTNSQGKELYGAPRYAFEQGYVMNYLAGSIWAPENTEYPYGLWTMSQPDVNADGDALDQHPKAWNLIAAGYGDAAGGQDGFYGMWNGYTQYAMPQQTAVGIGDKKRGLNFSVVSYMSNGYPIYGEYTDQIFFHNTPNEWLEWTMIPAVATGDYDAISAGVKEVVAESNAPVVSTTYYNLQGQRVNEPQKGIYIVRSVKADGSVKATKVAF